MQEVLKDWIVLPLKVEETNVFVAVYNGGRQGMIKLWKEEEYSIPKGWSESMPPSDLAKDLKLFGMDDPLYPSDTYKQYMLHKRTAEYAAVKLYMYELCTSDNYVIRAEDDPIVRYMIKKKSAEAFMNDLPNVHRSYITGEQQPLRYQVSEEGMPRFFNDIIAFERSETARAGKLKKGEISRTVGNMRMPRSPDFRDLVANLAVYLMVSRDLHVSDVENIEKALYDQLVYAQQGLDLIGKSAVDAAIKEVKR
jgi:hypothetical protein